MNHIGTKEIRTDRLLLRRFRLEDVNGVYNNYGSDPEVKRFISFAPCQTREGAQAFVQMHVDRYDTDPDFYGWAVVLEDEVIGSVGLFNVDNESDACEVGASLGSKWWGLGIATEAVSALIDFAFREMGAHRIYGAHHIDNTGSGKVMLKSGMKREGIMRGAQKNPDGSFSDLVLYAILSTDR